MYNQTDPRRVRPRSTSAQTDPRRVRPRGEHVQTDPRRVRPPGTLKMVNRSEKAKGKQKEVVAKGKGNKRQREEPKRPLDESLSSCKVVATRFLDWQTVARLGLKADMEALFTEMGVDQYMHRVEFTHADETIQFMRSLDPTDEIDGITFRIHEKTYSLSSSDIREIYGFRLLHMRAEDIADQTGMSDLWQRIAGDSYRMGKSKSSSIRNPTVKLLQRALGFAFFGRYEVGPVILDEWRMISAALNPVARQLEPPVERIASVDSTVLFIENLFRTQTLASRNKPREWPLCIGGVLTPMFRHCGVKLSAPIRPVPLIDLQHLYSCRFLSPQRDNIHRYPFTWADQQMELPLPFQRRDLVTCSIPANLIFQHTPEHLVQYLVTPYQAPGAAPRRSSTRRSARYDRQMTAIPQTPFEKEVATQFSLLKRWNKWQDRTISKMAEHIRLLKAKLRGRGGSAGASSSTQRQGSQSPESSNPSLELSPPPSDHESETF